MEVIRGINHLATPLKSAALTIGNFDGVHVGHRQLITQVVEYAKLKSIPSVVITFDPHPSQVLTPQNRVPRLFSGADLESQLSQMGVDILLIEPFTKQLAQLTAQDFVYSFLWQHFHPQEIFVGYDFAFGHSREGSYEMLKKISVELGFGLRRIEPFMQDNEIVSSTKIRKAIRDGDVEKAMHFLSRAYYIEGIVESGEGRGEKIGFPTANLNTSSEVLPATGVYVTRFIVGDKIFPSVTNIGNKITFHADHKLSIETHVLNQNTSYVGQAVKVEFLKRLRSEKKFSSSKELVEQIQIDVNNTKIFFGL